MRFVFPGGDGRESIGKAGRSNRPAFIGLFGVSNRYIQQVLENGVLLKGLPFAVPVTISV